MRSHNTAQASSCPRLSDPVRTASQISEMCICVSARRCEFVCVCARCVKRPGMNRWTLVVFLLSHVLFPPPRRVRVRPRGPHPTAPAGPPGPMAGPRRRAAPGARGSSLASHAMWTRSQAGTPTPTHQVRCLARAWLPVRPAPKLIPSSILPPGKGAGSQSRWHQTAWRALACRNRTGGFKRWIRARTHTHTSTQIYRESSHEKHTRTRGSTVASTRDVHGAGTRARQEPRRQGDWGGGRAEVEPQ